MFLIEMTTKTIFPKDHTHSRLHVMIKRSNDPPPHPRTTRMSFGVHTPETLAAIAACVASATATAAAAMGQGTYHPPCPAPAYDVPSSSLSRSKGKVLRAFKSLINLCRSNAVEINKCHRGIKELQAHAGLPHSPSSHFQ